MTAASAEGLLRECRALMRTGPYDSDLLARLDAYLASGGWVSVEERLPEEYQPVLVCRADMPSLPPIIAFRRRNEWFADVMQPRLVVSHWEPLPKLPAPPQEPRQG